MLINNYKINVKRVASLIIKKNARRVLIQLPDGLKYYGNIIVEALNKELSANNYKAKIFIWFGTNYGSCDIPLEAKSANIDLLINFGHSSWNK